MDLPELDEFTGIVGLSAGFVGFTLGAVAHLNDVVGPRIDLLLVGGGLVGFASAAWLVVVYKAAEITGEA